MTSDLRHCERHRPKKRAGFTLSELSAAMVAGSSIMLLCISMVHHSFQWSKMVRHRVAVDQSFDRLQNQIRRDAHRATNVKLDSPSAVTISHDMQTITLRIQESVVERVASGEDHDFREAFRLGDNIEASFSLVESPQRLVLSAKRTVPTAKSNSPLATDIPVWRHIEAVVGRRLELESAGGEK